MEHKACTACGRSDFERYEKTFKDGSIHIGLNCMGCGMFCGWEAQLPPESLEFKMPFGRHKDKSLGWILENDIEYCRWAENAFSSKNLGRRFRAILEKIS